MIACQRQLQIICEVLVMKMDVFKTLLLTRGCRYLHTFPRTIVLSTTMQSKVMDNSGIKKCLRVQKSVRFHSLDSASFTKLPVTSFTHCTSVQLIDSPQIVCQMDCRSIILTINKSNHYVPLKPLSRFFYYQSINPRHFLSIMQITSQCISL